MCGSVSGADTAMALPVGTTCSKTLAPVILLRTIQKNLTRSKKTAFVEKAGKSESAGFRDRSYKYCQLAPLAAAH